MTTAPTKKPSIPASGQIDYDPFKDWHIGIGGRYEVAAEHFNSVEVGFYQIGNISPYHQQAQASSFTPKVTVSHDLDANETLYASVARASAWGGPHGADHLWPQHRLRRRLRGDQSQTQPTQFGSDNLWTYEFGSKGHFFGNRLSLNAATFYTDWHNIQQQIYLPTCGYYFTENVG